MMSKKRKCIFLTLLILFLISTFSIFNMVYAAEISENSISNSNNINGGIISQDYMHSSWWLLCCQHGPNVIHPHVVRKGNTKYVYKTSGYHCVNRKTATPMEAYILNYGRNNVGGYPSYVQIAWWMTPAGSHGANEGDNGLSLTAKAYENFVSKIANLSTYEGISNGKNSVNFPKINHLKTKIKFNKVTKTGDNSYQIEKISTDGKDLDSYDNYDYCYHNVELNYDYNNGYYMVGPFSVNYVEDSYAGVDFGFINDYKIYDQNGNEISKDNWSFIWINGQRKSGDNAKYPHCDEVYYIKVKYDGNLTAISKSVIDYKYLVAGGEIAELEENDAHKETWKRTLTGWRLVSDVAIPSQDLAAIVSASRWYQTEVTETVSGNKSGYISITKRAIDENGKECSGEEVRSKFGYDQFFKFKVTVNGTINGTETCDIFVRAGETINVGPFVWDKNNSSATYSIEEYGFDENSWDRNYSISNPSGSLVENNTVSVTAVNRMIKQKGSITINKTLSDPAEDDEQFIFEVVIKDNNGNTKIENATIDVRKGEKTSSNPWVKEYEWYGDKAPTYVINEVENEWSKRYESYINPSSGSLADNNEHKIIVNAYNNSIVQKHENKIAITKKLTQPASYNQKFDFDIIITNRYDVNGNEIEDLYDEISLDVSAGELYSETEYTDVYSWYDNSEAPTYIITEKLDEDQQNYKSVINPQVGSLDENKQIIEVTATNVYYSNYIILDKHTSVPTDQDETFKFKITVKNLYDKDGKAISDKVEYATVVVPSGETTGTTKWSDDETVIGSREESNLYEWWNTDKVPTYTVEELETPDSIKYNPVITPSSGSLDDNGLGVAINVVAVNKREKTLSNMIQINKKVTQASNEDEEFKFKVNISGFKYYINESGTKVDSTSHEEKITITVKKGSLQAVGYTSNTYYWEEDGRRPTYTIEEVDNTKGYKCTYQGNGETRDDGKYYGKLDGEEAIIIVNATNCYYQNNINIQKFITEPADEDEIFNFEVKVGSETENASLKIVAGSMVSDVWTSKTYKWTDENNTPEYEIKEISVTSGGKDITDKYKPEINPSKGKLDGKVLEINVTARNVANRHVGYLVIEKDLADGQISDQDFEFNVSVKGSDNDSEFNVKIKAGEKAGPYKYTWTGDTAPTYEVKEITTEGIASHEIINAKGSLIAKDGDDTTYTEGENVVTVICKNTMNQYQGNIVINKILTSDEKMTHHALGEFAEDGFDIKLVIEGTFQYCGENYINSSVVINDTINYDSPFESDTITWYGTDKPTYYVIETSVSKGWVYKSTEYTNSSGTVTGENGVELQSGSNTVNITNHLPTTEYIDLTFSMGGIAWVDKILDEKNTDASMQYNSVYDEGEELKANVEVYIYEVHGGSSTDTLATAYSDINNSQVSFPLYTKADGSWNVPRVKLPGDGVTSYEVRFVYDGQTYEKVDFLAEAGGNASTYIDASAGDKEKYYDNSMVCEELSNNSNNIGNVYGGNPIDANGDTRGYVDYNGQKVAVDYVSDNAGQGYPTKSKLVTTDENGVALDIFKTTATTYANGFGLSYPFDISDYDGQYLTGIEENFTVKGIERTYKFTSVYNHCLNINLGLKERVKVDIGLTKNLKQANVVVNENLYQYNYNSRYDLTMEKTDVLSKEISFDSDDSTSGSTDVKCEWDLGLYKSDYYYRAEMYNTQNSDVYSALSKKYTDFRGALDTDMEVYLTYVIKVQNSSPDKTVVINSIDDYYDSSFELVKADISKYLEYETIGTGAEKQRVFEDKLIVKESDYSSNWVTTQYGIIGPDKDKNDKNITYNKMTGKELNISLAPGGDSKEITLTYRVKKNTDSSNVEDSIILGLKSNVAEISNYYSEGKLDMDSAPGNVNVPELNSKSWYEDDTFAAPKIHLKLIPPGTEGYDFNVSGTVWEDNSSSGLGVEVHYNQKVGDGKKGPTEKAIKDINTDLVEKVYISTDNENFTEYDFICPTDDRTISCFGGQTIEELYGFDSTLLSDDNGEYKFTNIPTGDYAVRFTYGNNPIESADYSQSKFYNGQDYKSGTLAIVNGNSDYVLAEEYITSSPDKLVNTAIDSEVRRLQVVDLSRELTYANTSIMSSYAQKLFDDYYMFADTLKMRLDKDSNEFNNIGFAIEERPITEITLDKQIKEILLTTSDNRTIMKAVYNISYNDGGKTIKTNKDYYYTDTTVKVELDEVNSYGIENLQYLNRDSATNNGFRYINMDDDILQGAKIQVKYQYTAINAGEVDRAGLLEKEQYSLNLTNGAESACSKLSESLVSYKNDGSKLANNAKIGEYVGSIYYYGAESVNKTNVDVEPVVTTKVRQVIDYVDNDITFEGALNGTTNMSWTAVTPSYLIENNLLSNDVIRKVPGADDNLSTDDNNYYEILDEDGVNYLGTDRNNVIANIDDASKNTELIRDTVPYVVDPNKGYAGILLTVSKYMGSDCDDLQIDNIGEIIKYNNTIGRRDELATAGNTNPAKIGSYVDNFERDSSLTETITLSPPTGKPIYVWRLQIALTVLAGLTILAGGIILIKKKVLK